MTTEQSSPIDQDYRQLMARYERLMEISRQLNSTLDLGALLGRIIDAATELTNTEEASILLLDPATGELRFEAATNLSSGAMEAIPVPMEGSLAGWVATHGEPELVADARSDSRWYSNVDKTTQFITRNLLAVPMKIHNEVIGVVEAINKREDQPWTSDDVNTLIALANQAATAVQNVRLFQQSDFIAEMVHELRTPLAALKASTALLLRPNVTESTRRDIILTMQQETERLSNMANDFLDLARLESGRSRLETEAFSIRDLIAECVDIVTQQAAERQIVIQIHGDDHAVDADRGKIKQVILNLLTNAIKYNRENGAIYCAIQEYDAPKNVMILVQDTGQGINQEDQKYVFDKFYRIADTAGYTTGTGLGLAIAKRIVEAHGCTINLESKVGVGTTFYFTLPRAEARSAREKLLPGSAELSSSSD
jgi:signal transduction histidine kinase